MKASYITIEREYGSGGTKIARALSQATGVPCYGEEVLEEVSRRYGVSIDEIQKYEETVSNSLSVFDVRPRAGRRGQARHAHPRGSHLRRRAAGHPDVRPAGTRHLPGTLRVRGAQGLFRRHPRLHPLLDAAARQKRIVEDYHIAPERAEATRKRFDKKRANYYSANTTKKWDNAANYDIVLDSGMLGIDGCVSALKGFLI